MFGDATGDTDLSRLLTTVGKSPSPEIELALCDDSQLLSRFLTSAWFKLVLKGAVSGILPALMLVGGELCWKAIDIRNTTPHTTLDAIAYSASLMFGESLFPWKGYFFLPPWPKP